MISNLQDIRRKRRLLTQQEVCEIAGCSAGRLQYHTKKGAIEPPNALHGSRLYYSETAARQIAQYFNGRDPWQRNPTQKKGQNDNK